MNIKEFENYIKKNHKKHIIFDFDETICELLINWDNWYREIEKLASGYNMSSDFSEFGFQNVQNACIEKYN